MKLAASFLFALLWLAACSGGDSSQSANAPGADRDAHGCIPSAGYAWCPRTNQCERPWELAKKHAFENTKQEFDAFCSTPPDSA